MHDSARDSEWPEVSVSKGAKRYLPHFHNLGAYLQCFINP